MKIVEPSAVLLNREELSYRFIERIGRTCYKSDLTETVEDSIDFCKKLVRRKHYAMLEHLVLHIAIYDFPQFLGLIDLIARKYEKKLGGKFDVLEHFKITEIQDRIILTVNMRTLVELDDVFSTLEMPDVYAKYSLQEFFDVVKSEFQYQYFFNSGVYQKENTGLLKINLLSDTALIVSLKSLMAEEGYSLDAIYNEIKKHIHHTVYFVCDRGVSHEMVRHRKSSFAQESTRYCAYDKEKFSGEISVIVPELYSEEMMEEFKIACENAEKSYFKLRELNLSPELARGVLPTSLKTSLIVTANEKEWEHILNLRMRGVTGRPHPQIAQVMSLVYPDLQKTSEKRL